MGHTLSSRERLHRLFAGRDIDRVPLWLLFPYFPSAAYADIFNAPCYRELLPEIYEKTDTIERYAFDGGFLYSVHPDIETRTRTASQDGSTVTRREIACRGLRLESEVSRGERTFVRPYVRSAGTLMELLDIPYEPVRPDLTEYRRQQAALGEYGMMGFNFPDPLSVLHDLCGETDFVLLCYTEPEITGRFLDEMHRRSMALCRYLLDNTRDAVFWISGAEFATPPMLPPSLFEALAGRYTRELCSLIRERGGYSMIHCHGRVGALLHDFRSIAPDAIHPIEAPPMGDCTPQTARAILSPGVILTGNIQYGDLFTKTPGELEADVEALLDQRAGGPMIIATTGGPSAPFIDGRVAENYRIIMETAARGR